jgi:hypothetical protein
MIKVTFPLILSFGLFGLAIFFVTSMYYQHEYLPKGNIVIIPDDVVRSSDTGQFFQPTIVLSDPTLEHKFVGNDGGAKKDERTVDNSTRTNESIGSSSVASGAEIELVVPAPNDSWVKAGQPYVVPQLSQSERSQKIKRFLPPKNGADNGN